MTDAIYTWRTRRAREIATLCDGGKKDRVWLEGKYDHTGGICQGEMAELK